MSALKLCIEILLLIRAQIVSCEVERGARHRQHDEHHGEQQFRSKT